MVLSAIFCLFAFLASSQDTTYFKFEPNLIIKNKIGDTLSRAFCGGFRSPMFSELDADNDGDKDIFVFDRFDKSVSIFLYDNGDYQYAPDFEYYFPPLTGWVLLRDYNCDGKNDIFAKNFTGVQVWENTTTGDRPSFSLVTNSLQSADGPVAVLNGDIPAIDDIDGDGDMDILTFGSSSTYVTYYRNDNGGCDLDYSIYTQCWGHFSEGGFNSSITLNDSCGGNKPQPNTNSGVKHTLHAGSTLATFDYDADGDKDLIVGDISSNSLKLLINGGNPNDALITQVIDNFPAVNPVDIYVYPAGYFIDVDHDGDDDFIASLGEYALSGGRNYNNSWYYENTSITSTPNFVKQQENFLTDLAIEVGSGAAPHFYDFDHDGDMDLIIGSFVEKTDPFNLNSKLYLYENIGDSTQAVYQLLDDDFASMGDTLIYGLVPTTGDIDNDGDIDLILGTNDGYLILLENLSLPGIFPVFANPVYKFEGIDIGFASSPCLVDLDRDNDLDLIVGEGNGNLNYFRNEGNVTSPSYNIITDSLGKVSMQNPQFPSGYGYSTPYISQLDSNNNYDLVVGSYDGLIRIFMNIENFGINDVYTSTSPTYFNSEAEVYYDLNFSTRTKPALADINGDGLNDLMVGIFRGGIHMLKNNSDTSLIPNIIYKQMTDDLIVYPNPNSGNFIIQSGINKINSVSVYNTVGELLLEKEGLYNEKYNVELFDIQRGVFIVRVGLENGDSVFKKIILK